MTCETHSSCYAGPRICLVVADIQCGIVHLFYRYPNLRVGVHIDGKLLCEYYFMLLFLVDVVHHRSAKHLPDSISTCRT